MIPTDKYMVVMGSDSARDGMFLELWEALPRQLAMEAFYSDQDGSLSFEQYRMDVPTEVEAWFREEAIHRLQPRSSNSNEDENP